jgi:putative transcriptional regulator
MTTKVVESPPTNAHHPVRIARGAYGFTQETLAAAVGITRQTVISIESGDYAPSVVLAIRIARCVHATVEDLWGPAADAATAR